MISEPHKKLYWLNGPLHAKLLDRRLINLKAHIPGVRRGQIQGIHSMITSIILGIETREGLANLQLKARPLASMIRVQENKGDAVRTH